MRSARRFQLLAVQKVGCPSRSIVLNSLLHDTQRNLSSSAFAPFLTVDATPHFSRPQLGHDHSTVDLCESKLEAFPVTEQHAPPWPQGSLDNPKLCRVQPDAKAGS